jgi:hypothetical protein
MSTRIVGNAGSEPQNAVPLPSRSAPAGSAPEGRLVIHGTTGYVDVGGQRIKVDLSALMRSLGQTPLAPIRIKPVEMPPALGTAIEAAARYRASLEAIPGVVSVRAGYKFERGRITKTPAIVISIARGADVSRLPRIDFPHDVVRADPYELLRARCAPGAEPESFAAFPSSHLLIDEIQRDGDAAEEEAGRVITYRPPAGASLPEVRATATITCHVSPDAGWHVLQPFLQATREEFVLGMYDFTAPHIYTTIRGVLVDSSVDWKMTLGPKESLPSPEDEDSTKAGDKPEAWVIRNLKRAAGSRLRAVFAGVGSGQTFASAYHIKVGVRDSSAFWLSSGNWQSSNQPNIDFLNSATDRTQLARYNREWHVVVENEELAKIFKTYLEGDFQTASSTDEAAMAEAVVAMPDLLVPEEALFAEERASRGLQVFAPRSFRFGPSRPLRIQPILTPDNYVEIVRNLLRRPPHKSLYFQNQSLNPIKQPTEEFTELMKLLVDYSNDETLDVRIIFRNIGPVRKKLESLQAIGFNMERVRMQAGCHTKGIIIDSKVVLVGSHNFTNDGVQFNRDASVLIHDEDIARYYEDVFLHDWERLARDTIRDEFQPMIASGMEGVPVGYVRVPWSFYDEND